MKADKKDIHKLKFLEQKAERARQALVRCEFELCMHIIKTFGVNGFVEYLDGVGFTFAPLNKDKRLTLVKLIADAENGVDINAWHMIENSRLTDNY